MKMNLPVTNNEYVLADDDVIVTHTDLSSRITYASDAFVRSSGYSRQETIGQPQNMVRHPDMPEAAFADLWQTIQSGRPWTGLVKNRRKNGDFYWVRANVTPFLKGGQAVGYMSVRVKPTRQEIETASTLYASMREGRASNMKLSGGELIRNDLFGKVAAMLRLPIATRLWATIGGLGGIFSALAIATWLAGGEHANALAAVGLIGATLSMFAAFYLAMFVAAPLRHMISIANKVASCDIHTHFAEEGDHEVRAMSRMLNQMNANLLGVLTDANASLESMSLATSEVARGNIDLSSRTEEQASSLEETASAMEELTSTVKQNAENAKQANTQAAGASTIASSGGAVVKQVEETMHGIVDSSKRIADIIGVIDGIAFQTNILALNAAVEAARAGEQGRGFAVVAAEVRNLAQRSAVAAKEIKELITDSTSKVSAGTKLVDEAGLTMEKIVTSVKRVTDIMSDITAASQEQSVGIEQVCTAVAQMDEVTQQNAALVEEAAAAAESLDEQSGLILSALSVFSFDKPAGLHSTAMSHLQAKSGAKVMPMSKRPAASSAIKHKRTMSAPSAPMPRSKAVGGNGEWTEF